MYRLPLDISTFYSGNNKAVPRSSKYSIYGRVCDVTTIKSYLIEIKRKTVTNYSKEKVGAGTC